jgi:tight adherence protein B
MPFGVALIIWMMNHTFLSPLWSDPIGPPMIGGMLTMMVVGAWWMSRIIQIRV